MLTSIRLAIDPQNRMVSRMPMSMKISDARAAAECPDEKHDEIDYRDEHENHRDNPVSDGDYGCVAGELFLFFHITAFWVNKIAAILRKIYQKSK